MLCSKFIFNNIIFIKKNLKKRKYKFRKNLFLELFNKKLFINKIINNLNKKKKKNNKKLEKLYIKKFLKIYKIFLKLINKKLNNYLLKIPNLIHKSLINKNKIVKSFNFHKKIFYKKKYFKINRKLGIDCKIANEISGYGFTIIKDPLSYLYRIIIQFMLNIHVRQHNYKEIIVPYIVNYNALIGSAQFPKFEKNVFKLICKNNNFKYLIPTSEVPLINIMKNIIVDIKKLPIKLISFSSCFRNESKTYNKISKNLIKQFQFDKIELIHISDQKNSYNYLDETVKHAEKILKKLNLPYRIILLSFKNTGITSVKTFDIEVWLPNLNNYCEISSCSNTETYQSFRIKSKYKINNKIKFSHIINGSGLAIGRTLIAIIENYKFKNKYIIIPKILRKYINNKKILI